MDNDLDKLRIDRSPQAGFSRTRRPMRWFLAAAAVLALAGWWWLTPTTHRLDTAQAVLAYPSRALTLVNATGYVVADRKAALAAKITSTLVWLGVEEGSRVQAGQIVARLENLDVTAALEKARADLSAAEYAVDVAQAELEDARLNHDRLKALVDKSLVARADYDAALARYRKAQGNQGAARLQAASARAALEVAAAQAGYTEIRAPFDAVVLTKSADVGDIVTPIGASTTAKASVVTIADLASLQVEADVSESNLAKVKPGQACEIQLDAYGEERFPGFVHMIVPTADKTKATVLVKVRFRELDPRILPQMSAKVAFLERAPTPDETAPRLAVSARAVVGKDGARAVFVVRDGKARHLPVTTGKPLGDMLEIASGLKPGDRVVLSPPESLRDGDAVAQADK